MCILCVIQKWSRRIATMLPWLVVPLIGLWALSQLLPPAFRFEITSPRLACVFVLLVTLFWYEILMPKLSAWRVRRNARLRERKRVEAIEIQKLRKTAIRKCRNCLTPYRDQNPRGGKFTCSYCGHISKRPVLDLPESLDLGSSGILKCLVGKGGSTFNGKVWSDNGWICGKDWLENGNWVEGPFAGKSSYLKNGGGYVGGENHCLAEKSYSNILIFTFKVLTALYLSIACLWRKIFRANSSRDDTSTDVELTWLLDQQGENGGNFHESRGEKARRKAEEKRQARLEKELLEEEERKQREEVARLVEECRRLRDEKLDKKECGKESPSDMDRNRKKESEKKHQEIKKERDRGSSKSNSDAEESERRFSKESAQNKKIVGNKCEQLRTVSENVKSHSVEVGHGFKSATTSIHNRGTAGTRYLDRMKGTFLSSSRAFSGSGFFGRSANISIVSSEHRPNASVDNVQGSAYRRNVLQPESASGRSNVNGDDKNVYRPVVTEPQPCPAPKMSWQQLFTRPSAVSAPSNPNIIGMPNMKSQTEVQSPPRLFDEPINFRQLPPSTLPPPPIGLTNSSRCLPLLSGAIFPRIGEAPDQLLPEESEIFEDPCYVPDPVSLLGPVSEPIDKFELDLSFVADRILVAPWSVKTTPPPSEVTKPSPIQSPLSRSRVSEERHGSSFFSASTPKTQDKFNDANDSGTWQMWNSSPLGQAGLGLVGGLASWLPELSRPKEDIIYSAPQKKMASLFKNDEKIHAGTHSSQNVFLGNFQNAGTFDSSVPCIVDGPWLPETLYGPTSSSENQIFLNPREKSDQNGIIYGSTSDCAANQQFYLSTANSWAKKDWTGEGLRDSAGNSSTSTHHISGLYSTSDVQRLWPYH